MEAIGLMELTNGANGSNRPNKTNKPKGWENAADIVRDREFWAIKALKIINLFGVYEIFANFAACQAKRLIHRLLLKFIKFSSEKQIL